MHDIVSFAKYRMILAHKWAIGQYFIIFKYQVWCGYKKEISLSSGEKEHTVYFYPAQGRSVTIAAIKPLMMHHAVEMMGRTQKMQVQIIRRIIRRR